jgi:hypothetical protein
MANPDHLKAALEGPEGIKRWRESHPHELLDLSEEEEALVAADFYQADLTLARLRKSNFTRARFDEANLYATNLCEANLTEASFRRARLHGTNLLFAKLDNADLCEAQVRFTVFAENDLSRVKGLDKVEHFGPSEITISTLVKSGGLIPEVFLRGCGVPEEFIACISTRLHFVRRQ